MLTFFAGARPTMTFLHKSASTRKAAANANGLRNVSHDPGVSNFCRLCHAQTGP